MLNSCKVVLNCTVTELKFCFSNVVFKKNCKFRHNFQTQRRKKKSRPSCVLPCLLFPCFAFLCSSCKSLVRALLWQVEISQSHHYWQPCGIGRGSVSVRNNTEVRVHSSLQTCCSSISDSKQKRRAGTIWLFVPFLCWTTNTQPWMHNTCLESAACFPFKCAITGGRLSCNLHPVLWWMGRCRVPPTSCADT